MNTTFGHRLRLIREHMGLDRAAFALRLGLSPTTVWDYEQGLASPDLRELGRIASALGVPRDYLAGIGSTFPWGW